MRLMRNRLPIMTLRAFMFLRSTCCAAASCRRLADLTGSGLSNPAIRSDSSAVRPDAAWWWSA